MPSNFVNFINVEELANVLAVFYQTLTDSPDSNVNIGKACHCLEVICEPCAAAFTDSTGQTAIPWMCEDISLAYKKITCSRTKNDVDAALKLLIGIPNQWISDSGSDFSTKSAYQALAFLNYNIGQYFIDQSQKAAC